MMRLNHSWGCKQDLGAALGGLIIVDSVLECTYDTVI